MVHGVFTVRYKKVKGGYCGGIFIRRMVGSELGYCGRGSKIFYLLFYF